MAHVMNEDYNNCSAFQEECPAEAITLGDGIFENDEDICTDSVQRLAVCPADAIRKR